MEECKCKPAKSYAERIIEYREFVSLVKKMRDAQIIYSATFPTGYGCYAPTEIESKVDAWIQEEFKERNEMD